MTSAMANALGNKTTPTEAPVQELAPKQYQFPTVPTQVVLDDGKVIDIVEPVYTLPENRPDIEAHLDGMVQCHNITEYTGDPLVKEDMQALIAERVDPTAGSN